ncbi:MAG: pyrroline-5-carboxylate reductase dimerization domain-containing protein [Candidatus Gracilibacteria bacterium]|nr:pyrroline-5-carboxylate reductase dimerization domain-containing protein [Candidatus Gracilibacteria bacterium]MDQ7022926.1 pyrroline-5-carboxylate reductase dimerization domain-containing protein [Candidatus Gracilibacteria bacterium]
MKIQFIGCGKMGEVILQNLLEYEKKENIFIETKTNKSKDNLKEKYGINIGINKNAEIIFLLTKPQQFEELNFEIFGENKTYFSFIAGLSIENIFKKTKSTNLIRAMPNTPMLVGKGIIGYFYNLSIKKDSFSNIYIDFFIKLFSKNSKLIKCDTEDKIDKITALSGSGPAYYYFIIEILEKKALEFGFSEIESEIIAENTFIGASHLLEKSGEKTVILRKNRLFLKSIR